VQRLPLILGAAAFGALALAAPAWAGCDPLLGNTPAGTAHFYDGSIGDTPARFALVFGKDGSIEGRYALTTSTSDNRLRGKIEPGGERFTLTETGADGKPQATFTGAFPLTVPAPPSAPPKPGPSGSGALYYPGPIISPGRAEWTDTNCRLVYGARHETGGASQEVKLNRTRKLDHPQFGHLYAVAGVTDDEVVNRRAESFRQAIADNKREEVVRHFRFPIAFTIKGKFVVVENERGLLARYDEIFRPDVREPLARIVPRLMEAAEPGVMFIKGIWLDQEGYVISF
jgi:hypothetical protein